MSAEPALPTTPASTWPDPLRIGYPPNPEQDGIHWLLFTRTYLIPNPEPFVAQWTASKGEWHYFGDSIREEPETYALCGTQYIGPCVYISEADIRAANALIASGTLEIVAQWHDDHAAEMEAQREQANNRHRPVLTFQADFHRRCAAEIRSMKP